MPLTKLTSLGITDGTIVNADINASAAIASTKLSGVGITEADAWRTNASATFSNPGSSFVTANWERVDTDSFDKIGTGLSESSGVFSFPSTGYYLINHFSSISVNAARTYVGMHMHITSNNSTYSYATQNYGSNYTANAFTNNSHGFIIKVTDTTNIKFKFSCDRSETCVLEGDSNASYTGFTCIKLAGI